MRRFIVALLAPVILSLSPLFAAPAFAAFTVVNNGISSWTIDGATNPTLTLNMGSTYTFNVNATGHPFYIKTARVTGTGSQFTEGARLRWHPAAAGLAAMHGEGKLSVIPGVGYDHPDQSHFNSRHFWEVGALDRQLRTGWMGRYLDRVGAPDNPLLVSVRSGARSSMPGMMDTILNLGLTSRTVKGLASLSGRPTGPGLPKG